MEQRRLRLGDILDDYCPRERRVTNHAIVAMVEEDIKQTRCTTCDAEHAYKGARVPRRRKKDAPAALYKEVLAGMPETDALPVLAASAAVASGGPVALAVPGAAAPIEAVAVAPAPVDRDLDEVEDVDEDSPVVPGQSEPAAAEAPEGPISAADGVQPDEGPVHRPLIRATLPRPEGAQKDARPVPEFTVRHNAGRGNGHGAHAFRGDRTKMRAGGDARSRAGHGAGGNGNRPQSGTRFGRPGRSGSPGGFRGGQPPRTGGRKGRG